LNADESIRTDASTVHRLGVAPSSDATPLPDSLAGNAYDAELSGARTVIRGSSRLPAPKLDHDGARQTPVTVAKVLLNTRLNHFYLEELIGGGGMGAVFRAHDEQLDRTVAVKVVPFVSDDPDLQRRFRNEAQSAAKLDHPHIARVFDVGSFNDWHYIVFEHIRGTNMRDLVDRSGPLSIDDAVYYTCQLADAIEHASQRGIVHRDIKPSNVIISEDDLVKLVDMGLARSENVELSGDMTASGVTLGTFDYISPEQARDPRDADVRSDIYSLGCTLYFMLIGEPPYPGGTMLQKLLSHGNSPPPDPRTTRPTVSDDLTAILHKMLAKSPEDRYQSARDLIADLKELANRENLTRAEALGVSVAAVTRAKTWWFEHHIPWIVSVALLLVSTLWMQILSVASLDDLNVVIPDSALIANRSGSRSNASNEVIRNSVRTTDVLTDSPEKQDSSTMRDDKPMTAEIATNSTVGAAVTTNTPPAVDSLEAPSLGNYPIPSELRQPPIVAVPAVTVIPDAPPPTSDLSVPGSDAPPTRTPVTNRLIRVIDELSSPADQDPNITHVASFTEAIRIANEHDIKVIELSVPRLESQPVTIQRDGLVIRSSVGGTIIRFQRSENVSMQRAHMMSIGANQLELQDVHLQWTVGSGEMDGGSMIAMTDNKLVRLSQSTLTIENPSRREEIFAFEVITDPDRSTQRQDQTPKVPGKLPLVAIELKDVIIRGEIVMIGMDFAAELQLQWDNGLLAISRQMIDTAGALESPAPTAGPIQVSLNRLTAYVPRGLVRMRLGVSGRFPVLIDRVARHCAFEVDPGVPHFQITGLDSQTDLASIIYLRGEANAYDAETTLSDPMISTEDRAGNRQIVTMNDILRYTYPWEDERPPRWAVRWSRLELPGVLPSQYEPADFRQDGTVLSGFDERLLPRLPARQVANGAATFDSIDD
jgi:serine/threonine-protein kinase